MFLLKCPVCKKYSLMKQENTNNYFKCDYCDYDSRNFKMEIPSKSIVINKETNSIVIDYRNKGENNE